MMNKRNVLKTLAMVSLLVPLPQLQAAASNEARKPNFVVILIDDMGKDLGVQENGSGVREPGRITEPKGLFMSGNEFD
jgi:hypothetical protein